MALKAGADNELDIDKADWDDGSEPTSKFELDEGSVLENDELEGSVELVVVEEEDDDDDEVEEEEEGGIESSCGSDNEPANVLAISHTQTRRNTY
jgi:hypothetical protein